MSLMLVAVATWARRSRVRPTGRSSHVSHLLVVAAAWAWRALTIGNVVDGRGGDAATVEEAAEALHALRCGAWGGVKIRIRISISRSRRWVGEGAEGFSL